MHQILECISEAWIFAIKYVSQMYINLYVYLFSSSLLLFQFISYETQICKSVVPKVSVKILALFSKQLLVTRLDLNKKLHVIGSIKSLIFNFFNFLVLNIILSWFFDNLLILATLLLKLIWKFDHQIYPILTIGFRYKLVYICFQWTSKPIMLFFFFFFFYGLEFSKQLFYTWFTLHLHLFLGVFTGYVEFYCGFCTLRCENLCSSPHSHLNMMLAL